MADIRIAVTREKERASVFVSMRILACIVYHDSLTLTCLHCLEKWISIIRQSVSYTMQQVTQPHLQFRKPLPALLPYTHHIKACRLRVHGHHTSHRPRYIVPATTIAPSHSNVSMFAGVVGAGTCTLVKYASITLWFGIVF